MGGFTIAAAWPGSLQLRIRSYTRRLGRRQPEAGSQCSRILGSTRRQYRKLACLSKGLCFPAACWAVSDTAPTSQRPGARGALWGHREYSMGWASWLAPSSQSQWLGTSAPALYVNFPSVFIHQRFFFYYNPALLAKLYIFKSFFQFCVSNR